MRNWIMQDGEMNMTFKFWRDIRTHTHVNVYIFVYYNSHVSFVMSLFSFSWKKQTYNFKRVNLF